MMQKLAPVHLFGTSESRLDARITDNLISIKDYTVLRRVIDKHAPIQHKRVKATKPRLWLTQELIGKMTKADQLKRSRRFDEYKKQRNYVLTLVEKAKNNYFSQLVKDKCDTSSIWTAINSITRKNSKTCDISANNIPPLPPPLRSETALTTISSLCSPNCFNPLKESSGYYSYIYILLPFLTSAGKSEDALMHFIYHSSLFMK